MTKTQDLRALAATGRALPAAGASKKELVLMLADVFDGKTGEKLHIGALYTPLHNIESTPPKTLRATPTDGLAFQIMVDALVARTYSVSSTTGSLMHTVGFTIEDLDDLACFCRGEKISGATMASRLRQLAHAC